MFSLVIILLLLGIWIWSRQTDELSNPPIYPGALPLIGHAHLIIGNSAHLYKFMRKVGKYCTSVGGVFTGKIGLKTVYVVTDPEDSVTVLNSCLQKAKFYEFGRPWLGDGLVTSSLSTWKVHRKLLNPAFSQVVLNSYLEVFNKQARRLVDDLSKEVGKGPFDHWVYANNNALETIFLTALGLDFNDKEILNPEYLHAVEQYFNGIIDRFQKAWWHNDYIYGWSELKKQQDKLQKILCETSETVLKKRKTDYIQNRQSIVTEQSTPLRTAGAKFKPYMDLLLELSIEHGALNNREIREHVDTMIVAGSDTVSITMVYCLLLIGSYPDVQEKIYKELQDVFGDSKRDVTKQDLCQLTYLEAVIKESLRFYPAVPAIARRLEDNIKLKNSELTPGKTCFILILEISRHTSWGLDADEFRPERWSHPASLPKCPGAFAVFGLGKRNCIGKAFGFMSMKTTLAHILRRYLVSGDHTQMRVKLDVFLKPVSGHYISIQERMKLID